MPKGRKRKSGALAQDGATQVQRKTRTRKASTSHSPLPDPSTDSKSAGAKRRSAVQLTKAEDKPEKIIEPARQIPRNRKRKGTGHIESPGDVVHDRTVAPDIARTSNREKVVAKKTLNGKTALSTKSRPSELVKQESEDAASALQRMTELANTGEVVSDSSSSDEAPVKSQSDNDEESDDLFEDVDLSAKSIKQYKVDSDQANEEIGDLNLTLEKAERLQLAKTGKKKQSVRAVHERAFCHYMSAIAMVATGSWRNLWINHVTLHRVLRKQMRRRAQGLHRELAQVARNKNTTTNEFVELMGRVMGNFNTHFRRTKHGLRKLGHRPVSDMDAASQFEQAAEHFSSVGHYIKQAKTLEGSRDFGAQLFTALLRAYHFQARLVFSTQPLGFKFNEREEYNPTLVKQALEETEKRLLAKKEMTASKIETTKTGSKNNAISLDDSDLSDLGSEYSVDPDLLSDLEEPLKIVNNAKAQSRPDDDLEYPTFWTEVYDFTQDRWIAIDAMVRTTVLVDEKGFKSLHPRGVKAEQQKLTLGFVVAYEANRYAKDVTMRYASSWAKVKEVFLRADGKTNTRYDVNKILVHLSNPYRGEAERREDDMLAFKEVKKLAVDEFPKTLADFKASPTYILDQHLREKDAFIPDAEIVGEFATGKGSKATTAKVYLRKDVVPCKTIENYHKEGRRIKKDERPMKMIKARAMTTNRIREHQQQLAESGEKHVMQGIYSLAQTEYIVPPPIKDGIIPKNAYGNADVFVESMVPQGATHLKLKGAARIARKLEIEHAEAVVGFEFKARGAIPVVLGVLVADENVERLEIAWQEAEEIRIRKEDKKRTDAALKLWAKFLKGVRIRHRINLEYGIPVVQDDAGAMFAPKDEQEELTLAAVIEKHNDKDDLDDEIGGGFIR